MLEKYKNLSFFERIMVLREIFAKRQIVGTGSGKVSRRENDGFREEDFEFVQLSDFLPEAELRCKDLGLFPIVSIEGPNATMTVHDELSDNTVVFNTPTCPVRTTGNGQALQALGAQISYSRRYLWYLFLDLCTHDELDEGLYDAGLPQKKFVPVQPEPAPQTVKQADVDEKVEEEESESPEEEDEKPKTSRQMDETYKYLLKRFVSNIMEYDTDGVFASTKRYGITPELVEKAVGQDVDDIDIDTIRTTVLTNLNELARRKALQQQKSQQ